MGNGGEHNQIGTSVGNPGFSLYQSGEEGNSGVDVGCSQGPEKKEILNGYSLYALKVAVREV
jgi:hypothetical protein